MQCVRNMPGRKGLPVTDIKNDSLPGRDSYGHAIWLKFFERSESAPPATPLPDDLRSEPTDYPDAGIAPE